MSFRTSKLRGAHFAIVVDNKDGDGNPGSRVKVIYPWLDDQAKSYWARIAVPMGGPDRGTYLLPESGDQVVVVFEQGDIHRPIVIGSLWSKKQEPVEVNASGENNTKLIKSRSGHRVIFDDKAGAEKITIVDKTKKNKIVLDSVNKIVKIESDGDIAIKSAANVIVHGNTLKIGTSEKLTSKGQQVLIHANSTLGLKASQLIKVDGNQVTSNVSNSPAAQVTGSGSGSLAGGSADGSGGAAGNGGSGSSNGGSGSGDGGESSSGSRGSGGGSGSDSGGGDDSPENPPPTVQIVGSAAGGSAPVVVVIGRDVKLFTVASPPGGTFQWSISGNCAMLGSIVGSSILVQGTEASTSIDDTHVIVHYTTADGTATANVSLSVLRVQLDSDADRDGIVENNNLNKATWTWGAAGAGAVLLPNLDDNDKNVSDDASDNVVNGSSDVVDLARLVIRRCGPLPLPHDYRLFLVVSDHTKLRIFEPRATVAIGPTTSDEYQIQFTDCEQTLRVEATQFPDDTFNGLLYVELVLRDSGGIEVMRDRVAMRVAPWMSNASHLEVVDRLFVYGGFHPSATQFQADISAMASAINLEPEKVVADAQWLQDCMEIGCASIPGSGMHAVLDLPHLSLLDEYSSTLLGVNVAVVCPAPDASYNTFNLGGNFECTPPNVTRVADGHTFPFGRIYTCQGRTGESNDLLPFLSAQKVQAPFTIDTTWLRVGHVDEVISFVPAATGANGFKMLIASTELARDILTRAQSAGNGSSTILTGRFKEDPLLRRSKSTARTIDRVLADSALMSFNIDKQTNLDNIRKTMKEEIGVTDADIIDLPVLYFEDPLLPGFAHALTGGVVNMLVANGHVGVGYAFGPRVGDVDLFDEDVQTKLSALGLAVHFIDDWYLYHLYEGEVHCGTNAKRQRTIFPWWEFVP